MRVFFRYSLILGCIITLLSGCSSTPERPPSQASIPVESLNIKNRKALAHAYYKERDYASSLVQWKILRTIYPNNTEYKNRIRVMEALVKRRTKLHISTGKSELKKKNYKKAELFFLKTLAMNPTHHEALVLLKKIKARQVEEKQLAKTKRLKKKQQAKATRNPEIDMANVSPSQEQLYLEMGINLYNRNDWSGSIREIRKYLAIIENDQKAKKYVANAHTKLSNTYETRGHLEPALQHLEDSMMYSERVTEKQQKRLETLKHQIAENYYANGIKAYRENINQAISFWERAIKYNPNHFKAQNRLTKARQIQVNLQKISQ